MTETKRGYLSRGMVVSLALVLLVLVAGGIWFYRAQAQAARRRVVDQLGAVCQLKVQEVAAWRRDRILDARELTESPFLAAGLARFLDHPDPASTDAVRQRLRSIQRQHDYDDVLLIDVNGLVRMSVSGRATVLPAMQSALEAALRTREPGLSELHRDSPDDAPHIVVVAPIFAPGPGSRPVIGGLAMINNAQRFLYPLLQAWPTPSQTAETLIVRKDGNDALFINDVRHMRNSAFALRVPLTRTEVPAVRAVLGYVGPMQGRDYRGVRVDAYVSAIPGTDWSLVAKIDEKEVTEEWRSRALIIVVMIIGLVFCVFAVGFTAWQHSQRVYFEHQFAAEREHRRQVERHRTTLQSIGDAVIATDALGRVELLNPIAESLTGWRQEEAAGKPLVEVFRIINETTRRPVEDPVARVLRDGVVVALANHTLLIGRDGTARPIADSGAPIRDQDGTVIGVVLVFRDQTAERVREQALLDSETKFRTLYEASTDALLLLDDTGFVDCNDAAVRMYRVLSKTDMLRMGPVDVSPEYQPVGRSSAVMAVEYYLQAIKDGSVAFEWMHRRWDTGEVFPVEVVLSRLVLGGRVLVQATVRDITERKRLEEALRRRIVALTQPIDSHGIIAFEELFDVDEFQRIQDEFAEATGVAALITRPDGTPITRPSRFTRLCRDVIRGTDRGRLNCFRSDAVIGCPNQDGPTIQPCLSGGLWDAGASIMIGERHVANWLIGQVRDDTQTEDSIRQYARVIGANEEDVVAAFRDVPSMSRERFDKIAQALFTLARQLSTTAYQNIQQARFIADRVQAESDRERLQSQLLQAQKMESIGRLAGGVAHDFNNMLGAILGYTELALTKITPADPVHGDLLEVQKAAQRSADLTRQLLAFARKQTIAPRVIDLNDTVAGLLKMLRRLIGEDISLVWKPGPGAQTVKMDPSQIDQVLANLCVNARDAIKGGGLVTIETANVSVDRQFCETRPEARIGDFVRLSVRDDGMGMEPEVLAHLFEPFFTTKRVGEGTGLGLPTVYGIVSQNGGFTDVSSQAGVGTTFDLYLPRLAAPADADGLEPPPPTLVKERPLAPNHECILLVEDEAVVLNMARTALTNLGYRVLAAATPEDALRLVDTHGRRIDVLLTDVVMPHMNGRALAERVVEKHPGLICVFMSGYTADVIAHRGVLDEGVLFVQKPFSVLDLGHTIRDAILSRQSE